MKARILLIVSGVVVFFGLGAFFLFRSIPQAAKEDLSGPSRSQEAREVQSGGGTRIVEEQEFSGSSVIYTSGIFSPASITIKENAIGDGCLIRIFNKGDHTLTIRLSPHSAKDDRGFQYSPILSGGAGIIDPRYHLSDVAFHNHEKPVEEFSVHLEKSCL